MPRPVKNVHIEPTHNDDGLPLIPPAQTNALLKKAGVKNIPRSTRLYYRQKRIPKKLRELVRLCVVFTEYTGMKTVMPKHVTAAYKKMSGKTLIGGGSK